MQVLLEQNRRLLDLIERKPETFHVMPELNKAIHDFDGEGSSHEAGVWLKSIDSMAVLHGWPDSFRLLHMRGPARFWLQSRVEDLITREDFKLAVMIDPGSSDCIFRHRAAEKCCLQVVCKGQDLNGFGNTDTSTVRSIGTSEVEIEIDDVVCHKVKVIVVNDSAQPVDLPVG
ncbi:hypothetical protein HPB47_018680 [Ixodes persulcatus]|uniref:Uncharacterized protein n=1 Tax=Ixodes persulcatus TaxID=34615 RepID=A0AC60QK47_IXOPE|nr:hypothetical protein HPB47_018680 [Ixodes persulcatus]